MLLKLCTASLRRPILKQMENTHFAENCITGMPLGYTWSVADYQTN